MWYAARKNVICWLDRLELSDRTGHVSSRSAFFQDKGSRNPVCTIYHNDETVGNRREAEEAAGTIPPGSGSSMDNNGERKGCVLGSIDGTRTPGPQTLWTEPPRLLTRSAASTFGEQETASEVQQPRHPPSPLISVKTAPDALMHQHPPVLVPLVKTQTAVEHCSEKFRAPWRCQYPGTWSHVLPRLGQKA